LDEIGDLPLDMQPKLLRVLEEKEFERVGCTLVIPVDFRLISATNQNLEHMVAEGDALRYALARKTVTKPKQRCFWGFIEPFSTRK